MKPINNTYSSTAYGLSLDLIGPCNAVICGVNLQLHDTAHNIVDLQGELYVFTNETELSPEWLKGFKLRVNGVPIEELAFISVNVDNGVSSSVFNELYGAFGKGYTLTFRAVKKPDLQPMDYAKALVDDMLHSADPGVGAIYTREVMEKVLAGFLNAGVIEVTTRNPGCGTPEPNPWEQLGNG